MTVTPSGRGGVSGYALAAGATAITWTAVVALHRASLSTLVSAHGLLHTAVARGFERSWTIARPENPFFAGERLPYYWFYHYVAGRLSAVAGVHPLIAFEALGLLAVALVWFSGAALGRRLDWGPVPSVAIGLFALAGANAFGSVILVAKLAAGKPWPADDGAYLWGLTHPVMGMVRWNDPGALYGPLLNFFLNNSSRSLALAFVLVMLLALQGYLENRRAGWLCGLLLAAAASTALSPIIGLVAAGSLSAALAGDWLAGMRRPGVQQGPERLQAVLRAAVALAAGCVVAFPTYYHLFGRSAQPEIIVAFRPDLVATIVTSIAPVMVLAFFTLLRSRQRRFLGIVVAASAMLLFGNTLLQIPGANESDLFHVAAFMLAVPAAGAFFELQAFAPAVRRTVGAAFLAAMASTTAVVLWAYWERPAIPLRLEGAQLRRTPDSSPVSKLYAWIIASTPADAIFITDPQAPLSTPVGNTPEFPALTGRDLFVGQGPDYLVDPFADAGRRRRIAATLVAGEALDLRDRAYVDALRRPVFIVIEHATGDAVHALGSRYGVPRFQDEGNVLVFHLAG
jgi:hypothetical protein